MFITKMNNGRKLANEGSQDSMIDDGRRREKKENGNWKLGKGSAACMERQMKKRSQYGERAN